MKILLILSITLLTSCATSYNLKECCVTDGIVHCSTAEIKTRREFTNGLHILTCGSEFKAGKVESNSDPLKMANDIIKIIDRYRPNE